MKQWLSNLTLEWWYKMLIAGGFMILVLALTVPMHGVPNTAVQAFALAAIFIGTGEWINHPMQKRVNIPANLVLTSYPRRPQWIGVTFDVLGLAMIVAGVRVLLV